MLLYRIEKYSPKALARIIRDGCSPSVPDNRVNGEDNETFRICTSTSIQNCLTSLGPNCIAAWQLIENDMTIKNFENIKWKPLKIIVMQFDTRNIPKEHIINSYDLFRRGLVPDAYITKEYWLLEPQHPSRVYVRDLVSVNTQGRRLLLPYEIQFKRNRTYQDIKDSMHVMLFRQCRWKNSQRII